MAPHSPLAARLARSQSGMRFPLTSFHERLTVLMEAVMGLTFWVTVPDVLSTNRPTAALIAVRPSPNRSYATPIRGFASHHCGTCFTAANLRSGTHPFGV